MPLFSFEGASPKVHPSAWIAPTATLVGDVTVEADASIWYGVVLRGDFGPDAAGFRAEGASAVARLARGYAGPDREVRIAAINGAAGAVIFVAGRPASIMGFVVRDGRVTAIDVLADPQRIARIDVSAVSG